MPFPVSVKHQDVMAALQPLCDLLGVTPKDIYAWPPLSIGGMADESGWGRISFAVVPGEPTGEYRPGVSASDDPDDHAELMRYVTVEIH